jgi:hypothetical protein
MKTKRLLTLAAGIVVLVGAIISGVAVYTAYSWRHARIVTAKQSEDIQIALKGTMGQVMFGQAHPESAESSERTGLNTLFPTAQNATGEGLIAAYQRDPKTFGVNAKLFDTALNAKLVGQAVQASRGTYRLPISSAELPLETSSKLDPWGHPYCITALKTSVVVVSGGPEAVSFSCPNRNVREEQIASAARSVFQTPGGEVVVVLKPEEAQVTKTLRPVN